MFTSLLTYVLLQGRVLVLLSNIPSESRAVPGLLYLLGEHCGIEMNKMEQFQIFYYCCDRLHCDFK